METRSRGFHHWTNYEVEGDAARIIGHFEREQTQAAIAPQTEFAMRFYGHGRGIKIGVRATAHRLLSPQMASATIPISVPAAATGVAIAVAATQPAVAPSAEGAPTASTLARSVPSRRVLASPALEGDPMHRDSGAFDPWGETEPSIGPPDFPTGEPPHPPGGGGGGFQHAPVHIELFAPGLVEPVQTWDLPEGIADNLRTVVFDPPGFPAPDAPASRTGWWRVTVTPTGPDPVMIYLEAVAFMRRVPFRTTAISARLFDHLFRVALEAVVPRAEVDGNILYVGIGEELAAELGVPQTITRHDISPINAHGKLASLTITAVSGSKVKQRAQEHGGHERLQLNRIHDDDIAIRIQAAIDKGSLSVYGFDLASLDGEFGDIFLSLNRSLTELVCVSLLDIDFSSLVDTLLAIASAFSEVDHDIINTKIESAVPGFATEIRTYFREVLSRAVGQHAVVHEVSHGGGAWQIRYYDDPPLPSEDIPWRPSLGLGGEMLGTDAGLLVEGSTETHADEPTPEPPGDGTPPPAPAADPLGVFPSGFIVEGGSALDRLDRHQTIVMVMMENRSYDHLFGGLAAARPRPNDGYDGPPSHATNASAGGFLGPVPLVTTKKIGMGTAIPVSPRHYYHPVQFQIGDGTADGAGSGDMMGFARDLHTKSDSPQLAMTVYGEADLPIFYSLADDFCVCDRWFAAHPGPTWPNRFATLTGRIPDLDNFEIDDPRIGFLEEQSIFDVLNSYGIEWKLFESDLSQIRMFDRYRLDDRRVVPIDDKNDGLDATMGSLLPLPRVLIIEPNFADLPPMATANDDHPPADLAAGQEFIARICDAINRRFEECLLVITYDEHGGFYDHVPPPGTAKGDPALVGQIPKLHPGGPGYLGVRVPTVVVSPLVSAGKIDRTTFDHTSILKTILVHNRDKLPSSVLGSFGPRVNAAAHLGQVLDLDAKRQRPQPFDPMRRQPLPPTTEGLGHAGALDESMVAGVAAEAPTFVPSIPRRTVTIVPRSTPPIDPTQEDPADFHAALRNALKPRR